MIGHGFGGKPTVFLNNANHSIPIHIGILKHGLQARKSSERNSLAIAKKINLTHSSPHKTKRKKKNKKEKQNNKKKYYFVSPCRWRGLFPVRPIQHSLFREVGKSFKHQERENRKEKDRNKKKKENSAHLFSDEKKLEKPQQGRKNNKEIKHFYHSLTSTVVYRSVS